jgi:hypothetical protein
MAAAPSGIMRRLSEGWALLLEGVIHQVARDRIAGMAEAAGSRLTNRRGVGPWAPPTPTVLAPTSDPLLGLARDLDLPVSYWRPRLDALSPFPEILPDADGRAHSVRRPYDVVDGDALAAAGVRVFLCDHEAADRPRLWMIEAGGHAARFWRLRSDALRDAFRMARNAAFHRKNERLICTVPGAYLPLSLARWLRLASGLAPGPTSDGYAYPLGSDTLVGLRTFLGPLLVEERSGMSPSAAFPQRARGRSPLMAIGSGAGVSTEETWRWARAGARGPR